MKTTVALFFSLTTQWRWASAGMAGAFRMGIDYNVVESTAKMLRVEVTPDIFNDLRLMEGEALATWSRKSLG